MAALRDAHGIGYGLRKVAEALGHLRRRLEIELVVLEAHPIRFRDNRPGLQTEQDVMGLGVVAPSVVRIVGGDERNSSAPRDPGQALVHARLLLQAMVLNLEEVVVTKPPLVLTGHLLRAGLIPFQQTVGDLAPEATGERD